MQNLKYLNKALADAAFTDRRSELLSAPRILHLEHTNVCNLQCIACPHFYQKSKLGKHLEFDVIRKLEEILPSVERIVMHGGGEPFLYPKIEQALSLYRDYGIEIVATSNLTRLTPGILDVIRTSFTALNVSVDGATRATFEGIRKGAEFNAVLNNIIKVRESCPDLRMNMGTIVMRQNIEELPDMVVLAKYLGFDRMFVGRMITSPDYLSHTLHDDILLYPRTANRYFELARAKSAELGLSLILPMRIPESGGVPREMEVMRALPRFPTDEQQGALHEKWWASIPEETKKARGVPVRPRLQILTMRDEREPVAFEGVCDCLHEAAFINLNGDVATCSLRSSYSMGNLLQANSFMDIWNSESMQALRKTFWCGYVPRHCYDCQYILQDGVFVRGKLKQQVDTNKFKFDFSAAGKLLN